MQELKISRHATYFKINVFANGITPSLLPNLTKATIQFQPEPKGFNDFWDLEKVTLAKNRIRQFFT